VKNIPEVGAAAVDSFDLNTASQSGFSGSLFDFTCQRVVSGPIIAYKAIVLLLKHVFWEFTLRGSKLELNRVDKFRSWPPALPAECRYLTSARIGQTKD